MRAKFLETDSGMMCVQVPSTGTLQCTYSIDSGGSGRGTMTFTDSSAERLNLSFILVRVAWADPFFTNLNRGRVLRLLSLANSHPITAVQSVVKEGTAMNGTVRWFDNTKGYGFISCKDGQDVFVHYSSIVGLGYRT
jgi:hypothetical protein